MIPPRRFGGMSVRVAAVRSVLLYGARGTGKTMLVHAVAHESGACFFNLSPRHTDGKYQGKAACALMVHMVRLCACPDSLLGILCKRLLDADGHLFRDHFPNSNIFEAC